MQRVLDELGETVAFSAEAFGAKNDQTFRRLDKQLELFVGENERGVGALRRHVQEPVRTHRQPRGTAATVRRLAYEASDSGLLSPDFARGNPACQKSPPPRS